MRAIGLAVAMAVAVIIGIGPADARSPRPWCLMEGGSGPICLYYNFQQCYETSRGLGGICIENPALWGRPTDQPKPYNRRDGRTDY
jgi:Protein of unknown function (DUF3551)